MAYRSDSFYKRYLLIRKEVIKRFKNKSQRGFIRMGEEETKATQKISERT